MAPIRVVAVRRFSMSHSIFRRVAGRPCRDRASRLLAAAAPRPRAVRLRLLQDPAVRRLDLLPECIPDGILQAAEHAGCCLPPFRPCLGVRLIVAHALLAASSRNPGRIRCAPAAVRQALNCGAAAVSGSKTEPVIGLLYKLVARSIEAPYLLRASGNSGSSGNPMAPSCGEKMNIDPIRAI